MQDRISLFNKWGLSEKERAAWPDLAESVRIKCLSVASAVCTRYAQDIHGADCLWTGGALGFARLLFDWVEQLPQPEAVFILEEISRLTDKTVAEMREKQNADIRA